MEKLNFKKIIGTATVKTVIIAMAILTLFNYFKYNQTPIILELVASIFIVGLIGYLGAMQLDPKKEISHFIIGAIAYFSSEYLRLFFKFIDVVPDLQETAIMAGIFGAMSVGVLWVYKRY